MPLDTKSQNIRGLANIRTMAGRTNYLTKSYKVYLRVAILEMEKAHRSVEHHHISLRGQLLDRRFREIDDEKRRLFEIMSLRDATLKELRPAGQEQVTTPRRTAHRTVTETKQKAEAEAKPKAGALPQRQIAEAEKQRRRETEAARKHGPRPAAQGFKLRY